MTKSALKGCADDPRACRGVIRATLLTLPLVVFVSLALVPMSANIDNSGICVHRCEAYADAAPTTYAYDFLEAMAEEAGLSVDDAVATVAGVTATATGLVIANSSGIVLGVEGQNALDNLADAADYPEWDSLTSEQQTAWQSKDNYDAAKFNSLLSAFGLSDDRDRYYSSGGDNFEFTESAKDRINRLGRIGNLWLNKIGVAIGDLKDTITNRNAIVSWFPEVTSTEIYDGNLVTGWPSGVPKELYYSSGINEVGTYYRPTGTAFSRITSTSPVYGVIFTNSNTIQSGQYADVNYHMFSKTPFDVTYGWVTPDASGIQNGTSKYKSNGDRSYYYYEYDVSIKDVYGYTQTPNYTWPVYMSSNYAQFILYDEQSSGGENEQQIVPDRPEEVPDNTDVYYPPEGVSPVTVWNNYIEVQRPDNIYNPDDQSGKSEWKQETKQNVLPLQNIKFDKLFPFCLMTDVKDLTEKIEDTITPGQQSDYLTIRIPMAYASNGVETSSEDIELDGTPVRDLLLMVRPFNQVLLLFIMVFSLVMFWKSILTGD